MRQDSTIARAQLLLVDIRTYMRKQHKPPTYREMRDMLGTPSTSVVYYYLQVLVDMGCIEIDKGKARGIRICGAAAEGAVKPVRETLADALRFVGYAEYYVENAAWAMELQAQIEAVLG